MNAIALAEALDLDVEEVLEYLDGSYAPEQELPEGRVALIVELTAPADEQDPDAWRDRMLDRVLL